MSRSFFIAVLLLPILSLPVEGGQPLSGVIEGTVTNQQAAPLENVTVTITNIDSVSPESHRRRLVTGPHGSYHFLDVPEGRYSIVARMKGYRYYTIPEVTVRGGERVKVPDIRMVSAAAK